MDEPSFIHKWEMSSQNHQFFTSQQISTALGGDFQQPLSSESHTFYPSFCSIGSATSNNFSCSSMVGCIERPKKIPKTSIWNSCTTEQKPTLVPKEEMEALDCHGLNLNYGMINEQGLKRTNTGLRPPHADDHIIAERKRREKLNQQFTALAAIVPGLKKTDKASILGDTVKYVNELQERLKSLEDQKVKRTVETAVLTKKSQLLSANRNDSSNSSENCDGNPSVKCLNSVKNFDGSPSELPPEIKVRFFEKTILVKIHCENRKGVLVKVLSEIEKLHLMVTNAGVMPFLGSFLDITVTAQMEEGFSLTVQDLVKEIKLSFSQFM